MAGESRLTIAMRSMDDWILFMSRSSLRITGEETTKGRHRRGWTAADDAMLKRIASSSMDQLAAFLASSDVAPNTPAPPAHRAGSAPCTHGR